MIATSVLVILKTNHLYYQDFHSWVVELVCSEKLDGKVIPLELEWLFLSNHGYTAISLKIDIDMSLKLWREAMIWSKFGEKIILMSYRKQFHIRLFPDFWPTDFNSYSSVFVDLGNIKFGFF